MKQAKATTVDDKPRWIGVALGDVAEFGVGIFKTGGWMRKNGVGEDFIEVGGSKCSVAVLVDLER